MVRTKIFQGLRKLLSKSILNRFSAVSDTFQVTLDVVLLVSASCERPIQSKFGESGIINQAYVGVINANYSQIFI